MVTSSELLPPTQMAVSGGTTISSVALPLATAENEIKILLDGDRLRVSAYVDAKGAKKLLRALKANMALLEDDETEEEV